VTASKALTGIVNGHLHYASQQG